MDLTISLSRLVWPGFLDAQEVHGRMAAAFGVGRDADRRRYLFRADHEVCPSGPRTVVLAQHAGPGPDPEALGVAAIETKQDRRIVLVDGSAFRFFLRANATRAGGCGDPEGTPKAEWTRGKRQAIVDREGRAQWLERASECAGFRIRVVTVHDQDAVRDLRALAAPTVRLRGKAHGGERAVVLGVDFRGTLVVTDVERMAQAVLGGLGAGKAWGFGLLSLAQVAL